MTTEKDVTLAVRAAAHGCDVECEDTGRLLTCRDCAEHSIPPAPAHVRVSNGEDALDTCSGCGWESWDTYPTFEEHVFSTGSSGAS